MENYRPLTFEEIEVLQQRGCQAEDWNLVSVSDGFRPECLENVSFSGCVRLGVFDREYEVKHGVWRPSGIRRAVLHDVTVGDNALIENIGSYIAHYDIGEEAYVSDVGCLSADEDTSFGIGSPIALLSEGSLRFLVFLHDKLSAQEVYLRWAAGAERLMDSSQKVREELNVLVRQNVEWWQTQRASIGKRAVVCHVGEINNTYVGAYAVVSGVESLDECCLLSEEEARVCVTNACVCRECVLAAGAKVSDGVKAYNCFIGQGVCLGKGFSAEQSVFFANSHMDNGEACAVCAGPFTVSHHKSTLLIGGMFSFLNAGSGTNMSNHLYKIGPVHYGILQRGCKTASGTHLVWPGKIGDFSMIMGKYDSHVDLREFPFSYVFGEKNHIALVPAVNFLTLGTYRDLRKWSERDKRSEKIVRLDQISTFDALNPHTVQWVVAGRHRLEHLLANADDADDCLREGNLVITRQQAQRGCDIYRLIEELYIARYVGEATEEHQSEDAGSYPSWTDMLGLLVPDYKIQELAIKLSEEGFRSFDELLTLFEDWAEIYPLLVERHIRRSYTNDEIDFSLINYENNLNYYYDAVRSDLEKDAALLDDAFRQELDLLRKNLEEDRSQQLKKAKEKISSLVGRCD